MAMKFLRTCRRHWRFVGLATLTAITVGLLAAHRAVPARGTLVPGRNPWGYVYMARSDTHRLTVTTDVGTAENCARLAARFVERAVRAACAHSVLTVTLPPASAPGHIEERKEE